ncbi:MAG: hypothetical protein IH585_15680, partial [Anaerolineaceae bacterium]|nr:hypothetical protein [Anaerolineaceae bacterium]
NFEPQEEDLAMETYRTWVRMFELQRYYSWIVDRFHLSTQMYQLQRYGKYYDFGWLEERLLPLGFRLVLCTRTLDSFAAAREERLKVSGNPSQYDDLSLFIAEQERIQELASHSILTTLHLDVSDNSVSKAADAVADWLEATGGLYLEE